AVDVVYLDRGVVVDVGILGQRGGSGRGLGRGILEQRGGDRRGILGQRAGCGRILGQRGGQWTCAYLDRGVDVVYSDRGVAVDKIYLDRGWWWTWHTRTEGWAVDVVYLDRGVAVHVVYLVSGSW
ncbi:unnamed protein product, partial [Staurois parvus]